MSTGLLEISIELECLTSSQLQPKTFYTAFLDVDQKEAQLPQKKSTSQSGVIDFAGNICLRVTQNDLEKSRNEAKIIIYSIHNYGRKKLFGVATFEIDTESSQEMKLPLQSCSDKKSYIQLRSRVTKIQSRVSSAKNSQSSFLRYFSSGELRQKNHMILDALSPRDNSQNETPSPEKIVDLRSPKQEFLVDDLRVTAFQLPYRAEPSQNKISSESISKNLSLMQFYENAISRVDNSELKPIQNIGNHFQKKTSSRAIVLEKIVKMRQNLDNIHYKQDLFHDDEKIQQIIQEEDKMKESSILQTLEGCEQSIIQPKIRLESHTLDFVYYDTSRPSKLKVQRVESEGVRRRSLMLHTFSDQQDDSLHEKQTIKKEHPPNDTKLALIKPTRKQSLQEWENDDNLVNIVHEMINDVKGNLGYVKLSKLSQLRKKIKEIKDCNKNLTHANELLIQSQRFLTKKLQLAQEIITQKQKILAEEFQSLREQFKEVTKKLLDKYSEEILRENKIKEYQREMKSYESQVKDLMSKIELKNKQIQQLKILLATDEQNEKDKNQPSDAFIEAPFLLQSRDSEKEKNGIVSRSTSGNKVFSRSRKRDDSINSKNEKNNFPSVQTYFDDKKNLDLLKGISPSMKDFFISYIAKPAEPEIPKIIATQMPKHLLKKGRFNRREPGEVLSISDQDSINACGSLFIPI